jgi:hypothetical protein
MCRLLHRDWERWWPRIFCLVPEGSAAAGCTTLRNYLLVSQGRYEHRLDRVQTILGLIEDDGSL